jgi:hypothetical protein
LHRERAVSGLYKIIDASTSPFTDVTPIKIEASREHDLAIADYDGDLRPPSSPINGQRALRPRVIAFT